jgi:hypothetical protein
MRACRRGRGVFLGLFVERSVDLIDGQLFDLDQRRGDYRRNGPRLQESGRRRRRRCAAGLRDLLQLIQFLQSFCRIIDGFCRAGRGCSACLDSVDVRDCLGRGKKRQRHVLANRVLLRRRHHGARHKKRTGNGDRRNAGNVTGQPAPGTPHGVISLCCFSDHSTLTF